MSELEEALADAQKKLRDVERLKNQSKEMRLVEALETSLTNLEEAKTDIAALKAESAETKKTVEGLETQLAEVLALLRSYVADNRVAVDALTTYLKNWS